MTKKLIDIGPAMKKIRNTGKTEPLVDPAVIAAALGAEKVEDVSILAGGPLSLHAVRAEVFRRLQSSGGRPTLEGTTFRPKIPLSDAEWQELETIAGALAAEGCTPSPGQIASVLLNLALRRVRANLAKEPALAKKQLRAHLEGTSAKS